MRLLLLLLVIIIPAVVLSQTSTKLPIDHESVINKMTDEQARKYLSEQLSKSAEDINKVDLLNLNAGMLRSTRKEDAVKCATDALALAERLQYKRGKAEAHRVLSPLYFDKGDVDNMFDHIDKAQSLFTSLKDKKGLAAVYSNLGAFYNKLEDDNGNRTIDSSMYYLNKSVKLAKEINDQYRLYKAYASIADNYIGLHNYPQAKRYYNMAADAKKNAGDPDWEESRRRLFVDYYNGVQADSMALAKKLADEKLIEQKVLAVRKEQALLLKDQELTLAKQENQLHQLRNDKAEVDLQAEQSRRAENEKQLTIAQQKLTIAEQEKALEQQEKKSERNLWIIGVAALSALSFFIYRNYRTQQKANTVISSEKKKSDELLLNILPAEIADEIKENGVAKAKMHANVSVLFTDFVDFTAMSEQLSAEELVSEMHRCYMAFDLVIEKYGLEKIKTIGDAYMAASGLPVAHKDHATNAVKAAQEMQMFIRNHGSVTNGRQLQMRVGINSGPVVAGIVGVKKFAYDIWGDTVNTAARLEQNSEGGKINISGSTYELVKHEFNCEPRGKIQAKHKGEIEMYFVTSTMNDRYAVLATEEEGSRV